MAPSLLGRDRGTLCANLQLINYEAQAVGLTALTDLRLPGSCSMYLHQGSLVRFHYLVARVTTLSEQYGPTSPAL